MVGARYIIKGVRSTQDFDYERLINDAAERVVVFRCQTIPRQFKRGEGAFASRWIIASMSCQQLNELAEMDVAFRVMDVLRIGLHPTIGSGSQTENATIWKHVFSKWKKIAIAQEKIYEE